MSTALGLAMQISANTAQLATAVQDVNKRLDTMSGAGQKAARDLSVLKNIEIAKIFVEGIKTVAAGLTSAAKSAKRLFDDSRESIDQLGKLSKQTQISVEALQTYGAVADEAGVGSEEFARSLRKLTIEIGKADPDKDNAFKKIGLDIVELKKLNPDEIFLQVAESLANIANDADRAAAANEIFGRGGITLLPLINDGADALKRAADEAGRIGGVLTQEDVQNVEDMNDSFGRVGKAISGIINQVTVNLAKPLKEIADNFTEFIVQANSANIGAEIADKLLAFVDIFAETFRSVANFLAGFIDQLRLLISKIPGIDLETDTDRERRQLETKQARDAGNQAEITRLQAQIAKDLRSIEAGGEGGFFGRSLEQLNTAVQVAEKRLQRIQEQELFTEVDLKRLEQLRAGANVVSDTIDAAVDSITERIRQARERIADQRVDLAQPRVEDAQAQVDGVAQAVEDSNQEVVEATEENTAEIRGLRGDLRNQGQVVEIAG